MTDGLHFPATKGGFSAREFVRRVRDRAPTQEELTGAYRQHGDHKLNPDLAEELEQAATRDAAVLVPVVDRGDGDAGLILTLRAKKLRKHSGQVAFPGGAVDPEDGSVEEAAMREAEEEIALDRSFVEPVGRLPIYLTMTGFRITPVLALVHPGFRLKPDPAEVDDVFEVPLSFLMTPENHVRESRMWEGKERHYYTMPYEDRFIWGATAGILRTLYERLYE